MHESLFLKQKYNLHFSPEVERVAKRLRQNKLKSVLDSYMGLLSQGDAYNIAQKISTPK